MGQKEAAKKRMMRKATSYDLAKIIHGIKGTSEEGNKIDSADLGLIYGSVVINTSKTSLLSYLEQKNSDQSNQAYSAAERVIKKRFQEESRKEMYALFQDLSIGKKDFSELKDNYENQLLVASSELVDVSDFSSNTIEGQIVRAISDKNISFHDIGNALETGAENYVSQKERDGAGTIRYKLFLEYNRILNCLKGI